MSPGREVKTLMKTNPVDMGFVDSYWYWRIRAETAILDPENLPKKSARRVLDGGRAGLEGASEECFLCCVLVLPID